MRESEVTFLNAIREGDVETVLIEQGDANANMLLRMTVSKFHHHSPRSVMDRRVLRVSALHAAAGFGKANVVKVLLEKNADISSSTPGDIEEPPLMVALRRSFFQVAEVLLQHGADPNKGNQYNTSSPLLQCSSATHAHFIPTLLRYGALLGAPLHEACRNQDLQSASILVEHGADVNVCNELDKRSPIFSVTNNPDIMQMLIAHGAQVNLQDHYGHTPLHCAVYNATCCEMLLSNNASIDVQSSYAGVTPLYIAVDRDRFEIVRVLLAHQRSRHGQDGIGSLLLRTAHSWGNLNVLHRAGSARTARLIVEQCRCEDGTLLAACHRMMFARDDNGSTPLESARTRLGVDDVVEYLESFTVLTLATSEVTSPDDSIAVMLNPNLDDFQRAIATDYLDLIHDICMDVPDAALYVTLGYLSSTDVMKR